MPKRTKPVDPLFSDFPARLRAAHESSGLGFRELARLSGVDQGRISRYERGQAFEGMSADQVIALAVALGVRPGWLLSGELPIRSDGKFLVIEATPQVLEVLRQASSQVPVAVGGRG